MNFLRALDGRFRGAVVGSIALLAFYYFFMKPVFGL